MLTVALCGNTVFEWGNMRDAVLACARTLNLPEPSIWEPASPLDLLEKAADPLSEPPVDYVISGASTQGLSGLQIARDIREAGCNARLLLIEATPANAAKAQALGVEDYLVQDASASEAHRTLARGLRALAQHEAQSALLRFRNQVRRLPFSQFVYAQTANHDQSIHLANGQTLELRCSSQELFDKLSHDTRFLKVSRSFIVNLDHVRTVRQSGALVTFADGSAIDIPVRFRKELQNALLHRGVTVG